MGVEGRAALVTGAASGIGEGVARALAAGGAKVCAVDRDAQALERAVDALAADGHRVIGAVADIQSADEIQTAVDRTHAELGSVDILVNNAGVIDPETPIDLLDERSIDRVLGVNLKAQLLCCRAAAGAMKRGGYGRIVNVASRSWLGGAGIAQYAAAKAGVIGLTRSLALELGHSGITVNCVSPSLVVTPLFLAMPPEEREADLRKAEANPIPRLGQVEDIAHAVRFFAADEAGFVTGQHIYVSGGADLLTSGVDW